jgi:hypothetical protein
MARTGAVRWKSVSGLPSSSGPTISSVMSRPVPTLSRSSSTSTMRGLSVAKPSSFPAVPAVTIAASAPL